MPGINAACTPTTNKLRFACRALVEPAQHVVFSFWPEGQPEEARVFGDDQVSAEHDALAMFMRPATTYSWSAQGVEHGLEIAGTWTTGELPVGANVSYAVEGTSSVEHVSFGSPCGVYAVIAETTGHTVWYEPADAGLGLFFWGIAPSEDGTFFSILGKGQTETDMAIEFDLEGNELMRWEKDVDYEHSLHHDVFRKDGRTFIVFNTREDAYGNTTLVDGFHVFEGKELLGTWLVSSAFVPGDDPVPPLDPTHINSIWVDDGGYALLSMRHQSAIMRVDANPDRSGFGSVDWVLQGSPHLADGALQNDWSLEEVDDVRPTFFQQHHAHILDDGTLAMFDNGLEAENSRILHLVLDDVQGTATSVSAFELPRHCSFQGGSYHTETGNPLATCAPEQAVYEFDRDTGGTQWRMETSCDAGVDEQRVSRFAPWPIP